jgi:hypothetical protein
MVHQADAFGHRIGAGGMDQFIEEGVEDEPGTRGANRAPGGGRRQSLGPEGTHAVIGIA